MLIKADSISRLSPGGKRAGPTGLSWGQAEKLSRLIFILALSVGAVPIERTCLAREEICLSSRLFWLRQWRYCSRGLLLGMPEATTSGAAAIGAKVFSPIVNEIDCRLNGPLVGANGCRRGTHQVCKKKTGCLCVPC